MTEFSRPFVNKLPRPPPPKPSSPKKKNDFSPVKYNSDTNVLTNVLNVLQYKFNFKFKFLNRSTNKNRSKNLPLETVSVFANDIDDINDKNNVIWFANHFVNVFVKLKNLPLETVSVFANDIDDINDKNDVIGFVKSVVLLGVYLQTYCSSFLPEMVRLRLRLSTIAVTNTKTRLCRTVATVIYLQPFIKSDRTSNMNTMN